MYGGEVRGVRKGRGRKGNEVRGRGGGGKGRGEGKGREQGEAKKGRRKRGDVHDKACMVTMTMFGCEAY